MRRLRKLVSPMREKISKKTFSRRCFLARIMGLGATVVAGACGPRYLTLGQMDFDLYGDLQLKDVGVELAYQILEDRVDVDSALLLTRGWSLFLESQIGKIPSAVRDDVLERLTLAVYDFFEKGIIPSPQERKPEHHHLLGTTVDVCFGRDLFVLVYPRLYAKRSNAEVNPAVGSLLVNSLAHVLRELDDMQQSLLMFFLTYGLHKWAARPPGVITALTKTWDFANVKGMIEEAKAWK